VVVMAKPHENPNILDLIDLSSLNFDGGSRNTWGFL
jgi:hypothetical protein